MNTQNAEIELDECERCEGTGDRYGRAYPIAGSGTPCVACKGSGHVNRPAEGGGDRG